MIFKIFKRKQEGLETQRSACIYTTIGLTIGLVVTSLGWMNDKTIITVYPPGELKAFKIANDSATRSYRELWGISIANLIGNTKPTEANYLIAQLSELLTPEAFQPVRKGLYEHFQNLSAKNLVSTFSSREVSYGSDGRVYVTGTLALRGVGGKTEKLTYTFVIGVQISNYRPVINHLNFYEGEPKGAK